MLYLVIDTDMGNLDLDGIGGGGYVILDCEPEDLFSALMDYDQDIAEQEGLDDDRTDRYEVYEIDRENPASLLTVKAQYGLRVLAE